MFSLTGVVVGLLLLIITLGLAATLGWYAGFAWGRHPLMATVLTGVTVVYILFLHSATRPSWLGWVMALMCTAAAFAAGTSGAQTRISRHRVTNQ